MRYRHSVARARFTPGCTGLPSTRPKLPDVTGRRPPSSDVEADEAEYYGGGEALQEVATPENLALTDEIKRTVFTAIEALPEDLRTAITLREMEGLSYEEIAEIMDCPVGTVRSPHLPGEGSNR